jgi:hypothetical protein
MFRHFSLRLSEVLSNMKSIDQRRLGQSGGVNGILWLLRFCRRLRLLFWSPSS